MRENELNIPLPLRPLFSDEIVKRLIALRRDLHRDPELSFREDRTASRLYDELARLKPSALDRLEKNAVVAKIAGRNPRAPTVAVRADIDALPIQEVTGLPYSSQNPGVMHACGHDVHAAWGIGAAYLLAQRPAEGPVLIVLQPAEEIGKGALEILKTGVLDGVFAIFGGHVDRRFPVGQVIAQEGYLAASTDTFEIGILGRGAHGARPQEAADPIVAAAAMVGALQTIVSRRLNPSQAGVVTVGTIHAGSATNVIPERAALTGTVRAVDAETRQLLKTAVTQIADSTAAAYGVKAKIIFDNGTPPIVNPGEPAQWARQAVLSLLGEKALVPLPGLNMVGEDFAYYLETMQGCFLRIGACEEVGKQLPSHSPYFYAAEESIFVGAAVLAETARRASAALARG